MIIELKKSMIKSDADKKAYIRGAFLGGGSISNPEKRIILNL